MFISYSSSERTSRLPLAQSRASLIERICQWAIVCAPLFPNDTSNMISPPTHVNQLTSHHISDHTELNAPPFQVTNQDDNNDDDVCYVC